MKRLRLWLDPLYEEEYFYTDYDVGGESCSIAIERKDKEVFLDAWAKEWRDRAEKALKDDYRDIE